MRTPVSGTPAAARSRSTTATPAPVVPAVAGLGAELLQHQLRREVVAVAIHLLQDLRQRCRLDLCEPVDVGAARAPTLARPAVMPRSRSSCLKRPAAASAGCSDEVVVVDAVVDDERRERRRLEEEERRLPAGRRPLRVEPRLVADDAPVDALDPGGLELCGEPLRGRAT